MLTNRFDIYIPASHGTMIKSTSRLINPLFILHVMIRLLVNNITKLDATVGQHIFHKDPLAQK